MRYPKVIALAALVSLVGSYLPAYADEPYYPFETIDRYYGNKPPEPDPGQPPPAREPAPKPAMELERTQPLILLGEAPDFLFPKELGFGVAVGIPYDLFYVGKIYYLAKPDQWYRANSYKGPWVPVGFNRLPPELRKHKLAKIRSIRNREFQIYFKNKEGYRGKHFRPGAVE